MKQKRSHTHKNEHRLARLSSSSHAAYSKMKHSFTSGSQSQRLHVLHNKRSLRIVLVVFGFVLILGIILIVRTCTSAPSQATESNNAASEESASDSSSENEIVTTTTPEGITFTGPASFPDSDAYATLVAAIDTFESNGFRSGLLLRISILAILFHITLIRPSIVPAQSKRLMSLRFTSQTSTQ